MKRFYREASAHGPDEEGGYAVLLDGRAVKTPGKKTLQLPTFALAEAIAEEWAAQGEEINPGAMPLMQLACSALDLLREHRAHEIGELAGYGGTEMLCYRAERPESLVERQEALWQPLLDWASRALDAPLTPTRGILHQPQPEASLQALRRQVEACDDMQLAGLSLSVRTSGSLIIGLALTVGEINAEQAYEAAELDASYQIELWGEDAEATKRRDAVKADLAAAERFFQALKG